MNKIKVLRNRKRRASKGQVVRLSDAICIFLDKKRKRLSYDAILRKIFALPDRNGKQQPLLEGWLELNTGYLYLEEQDALGAAVVAAARAKTKKVLDPVLMREVV